jgi:hypothetical protein
MYATTKEGHLRVRMQSHVSTVTHATATTMRIVTGREAEAEASPPTVEEATEAADTAGDQGEAGVTSALAADSING